VSSSGSCLVSPASAASSYLRTFFAHRRPQALHNVFGPRGPYNPEKLVGDRRSKRWTKLTFLHSGESVRPHVLQICCSPPSDFLSLDDASGVKSDLGVTHRFTFFLRRSASPSSSSVGVVGKSPPASYPCGMEYCGRDESPPSVDRDGKPRLVASCAGRSSPVYDAMC